MVLTNLQYWANWTTTTTTQSNGENSNLDRNNVDLFNSQTVNPNISHISSNGYYGFSNINNHANDNDNYNNNTNKVNQSPAGNNNDIKQNISIKQNETVFDIDTPMMDIVAQQSNGEHFVKMANGSFPAILNNNTSITFSSISNGSSCGGGVNDRKKRSCIDDDNEDDEELQTESKSYGKRVCPDNTWGDHHHQHLHQHFPIESSKSIFVATDNDHQQSYVEPMNVEPTNKKYENIGSYSETEYEGIQVNKNVTFCSYEVSVKTNIHANSSSQSHYDNETFKYALEKDNNNKINIVESNNVLTHIHNDNQLNNCNEKLCKDFNSNRIIGTRFDDDILLENLYYQTHGGGKYYIWQNDTEI